MNISFFIIKGRILHVFEIETKLINKMCAYLISLVSIYGLQKMDFMTEVGVQFI